MSPGYRRCNDSILVYLASPGSKVGRPELVNCIPPRPGWQATDVLSVHSRWSRLTKQAPTV